MCICMCIPKQYPAAYSFRHFCKVQGYLNLNMDCLLKYVTKLMA